MKSDMSKSERHAYIATTVFPSRRMAPEWKSIKVPEDVYNEIESLKIHPRQPAGEVIEKALELLKVFKFLKPQIQDLLVHDDTLEPDVRKQVKELMEKI